MRDPFDSIDDDDDDDVPEFQPVPGEGDDDLDVELEGVLEGEVASDADEAFAEPTHVFFENEPLIRALNDPGRADNDPDAAQRLFSTLVEATLIAMVPEELEVEVDEDGRVVGDMQLGFLTVRHPKVEGEIIPMFTDEGSLAEFTRGEGGRYVALGVRDLFPLLALGGEPPNVVINPGGDEALLLTPRMVGDLVEAVHGYRPVSVREGTDVTVALPEDPLPGEARQALREVLEAHADVARCFEFQWLIEGVHDAPAVVLAVEFLPGLDDVERRQTFESLQDGIAPALEAIERPVDLVDFARQRDLFATLAEDAEPLYLRAA